ncbi:phage tail protein, partial [Arthrospira platensis SPKY1]|nr:phage tail protein [Arthrospira platensis SPKY1]
MLKTNALDLSYITGDKAEQFILGTYLHLINQLMGVDDTYSITEISLDLIQPYNPTLTISNKSVTMTNTINDLRQTTIQNDGVYNNVQIGSSFGIRAVR